MRLFFYKKIKQESGMALLLILSISAIILPLLQALWSDSRLDYQFRKDSMSHLQARWNAKSGLDISLLRIYLFKAVGSSLPQEFQAPFRSLLDQSWQLPFSWPFLLDSEDLLESEKEILQFLAKRSFIKGSPHRASTAYWTSIQPEDGRLDLNDLSSPLPYLKDFTYNTLWNLLMAQVEKDSRLKEEYSEGDLAQILDHIRDWTDSDNNSQGGGLESLIEDGNLPLNRSFVSVEELKKVPKMSEAIFRLMEPYVTVYGSKSLNINYASPEVLEALALPYDVIESLLLRTQRGSNYYQPFSNKEEFCDFMIDQNYDFCAELIEEYETLDMLAFSHPIAFRIQSTGIYRSQRATWEALVTDLSTLALSYQEKRNAEIKRQENPNEVETASSSAESEKTEPTEKKFQFDYSYYKSLAIMYLKQRE